MLRWLLNDIVIVVVVVDEWRYSDTNQVHLKVCTEATWLIGAPGKQYTTTFIWCIYRIFIFIGFNAISLYVDGCGCAHLHRIFTTHSLGVPHSLIIPLSLCALHKVHTCEAIMSYVAKLGRTNTSTCASITCVIVYVNTRRVVGCTQMRNPKKKVNTKHRIQIVLKCRT